MMDKALPFDNSFVRLPRRCYQRQRPEPVANPRLIELNEALALQLGIDPHWLRSSQGVAMLAGNWLPANAEPIAAAYAGHQFGGWNPQLGDGRAVLLGELIAVDGQRYDLQLKGSGPTAFSRGGDGRAPLGPVLREYLLSEAMAALAIPTTRTLAAVVTDDVVMRQTLQPAAILARVAQSHIRIGTMQYFAARQDHEALQLLVEHVLQRHYPEALAADNAALALLDAVIARQAQLVARWQLVGFIHGVMNTDNMLLSGETIDYGPCAFIDSYDPATVYSSIDQGGRYAYGNQPAIAQWNLSRLAEALLALVDPDQQRAVAQVQECLSRFAPRYTCAYDEGMAQKLGLSTVQPDDQVLVQQLLTLMTEQQLDFTLTFRRLADLAGGDQGSEHDIGALYRLPDTMAPWLSAWRARLHHDPQPAGERQRAMYRANPVFIPRNHQVEAVIEAALERQDLAPFQRLLERLHAPFVYHPAAAAYALAPRPEQVVAQTFCGT